MKKIIYYITICLIITGCENRAEKYNEELKNKTQQKALEIRENYNQYQKDIVETNLGNLLNLERLAKDLDHKESKNILNNADKILNQFNKENERLVAELRTLVDSIKPTPKLTETRIVAMKKQFDESFSVTKSNYKLDSTVLASNKKMIDFLKGDCKYEIQNGQIVFFNERCLNNFNLYNSFISMAKTSAEFEMTQRKMKKILDKN
jgi:hypothetical protein